MIYSKLFVARRKIENGWDDQVRGHVVRLLILERNSGVGFGAHGLVALRLRVV